MTDRTARGLVRYRDVMSDNTRWDRFEFRPGDVVISTPAKAGTTWMQMICVLLVLQDPELPRPLGEISPWLEMPTRPAADVIADLDAQPHRRVIKSHTPLDGLPYDDDAFYICVGRDPRDMALSFFNHRANVDFDAFLAARAAAVGTDDLEELLDDDEPPDDADRPLNERFLDWVTTDDPDRASLADTMRHYRSFWSAQHQPNVLHVHYQDLKRDLVAEMRGIAARLGVSVPEARLPELAGAASFDAMRSKADLLAPEPGVGIWRDNRRFFDTGTSGKWKDVLTADELATYSARIRQLGDDDLVDWLHDATDANGQNLRAGRAGAGSQRAQQ